MVNGVSYTLKVKAVTDVAQSSWTPEETVIPFGQPIVTSIVPSGQTLTVVVSPNGRKIIEYHALALDSDPSPDDAFFIEQTVSDETYSGTVDAQEINVIIVLMVGYLPIISIYSILDVEPPPAPLPPPFQISSLYIY